MDENQTRKLKIDKQLDTTDYEFDEETKMYKVYKGSEEHGNRSLLRTVDETTFRENIKRIALSGLVFDALKIKRNRNIKFDLDTILNISGETGPYILYTITRLCSTINKFNTLHSDEIEAGKLPNMNFELLTNKMESAIIGLLSRHDNILKQSLKHNESSILCDWILDLCHATSKYYSIGNSVHELRFITTNTELSVTRIALAEMTRKTLISSIELLGLKHVEYM